MKKRSPAEKSENEGNKSEDSDAASVSVFRLVDPCQADGTCSLLGLQRNAISLKLRYEVELSRRTHSCSIPLCRSLAVLLAALAVREAECEVLLCVGIAQLRRRLEVAL